MNTITEPTLADNARNGSVTCIKAVPSQDGKGFNIFVNLSWKEGDLLLVTQRKIARTWKSADRLLEHINNNYQKVSYFSIFLQGPEKK